MAKLYEVLRKSALPFGGALVLFVQFQPHEDELLPAMF